MFVFFFFVFYVFFFFQAEDGIRDRSPSRGLGDVYKRQFQDNVDWQAYTEWEDLVNEKSVIKNVINPRMTAMGELVDENGNPINGQ